MTQLTYNEAFDPYHAAFRFLRLCVACDKETEFPSTRYGSLISTCSSRSDFNR